MDRLAGYWSCSMPREECRKYNEDGRNRGGFIRYKEVTGGKCQWGTVLKE